MCACIGGLDRAHTHLMTLDKKINDKTIINSINNTLNKRKAGIKYIKYKKFKLENIHDINQIMDSPGKNSYKTIGKLLSHDKIKNNFNLSQWPLTATKHAKNGGQYVYFKTPSNQGKNCILPNIRLYGASIEIPILNSPSSENLAVGVFINPMPPREECDD